MSEGASRAAERDAAGGAALRGRVRLDRPGFALDVELQAPARGITAVFGPSAAGKTSLLRCVAGLERAVTGRLEVAGEVWQDTERGVFLPPHRRPLGYVFQDARLFAHLDVEGNLLFGRRRAPGDRRGPEIEEVVDWLGLDELLHRSVEDLSGGERQRVAIGRALLARPRVLLMDEPLASLDRDSRRSILPYLERLHRRLALPVLYVSHSRSEVMRLADRVILLDGGRVRAAGPVEELAVRLDLAPFGDADEIGAVLEAKVAGRDEEFGLNELSFAGGALWVPDHPLPTGASRRVRVLARDVSLALERPEGTSILNVLPARVREVHEASSVQPVVVLEIGGRSVLLSRVTRKSVDALSLRPGSEVYAQIKSVALLT